MGSANKKKEHISFGEEYVFGNDTCLPVTNRFNEDLGELTYSVPPWRKSKKEWTYTVYHDFETLHLSLDCLETICAKLREKIGNGR